ncbi:MAG: adenylate/guanylate cyclase domain-containing protein, partial [Treponema sp.]|nr:adenylate/guanylate cyclase domain-containing protein [Treponema sp.]
MKNKEAGKRFMRLRVLYGIIFINAFFLILSAAIILSSMWINSEKNAKELSAALIAEIQNSVSYRTTNYFYPAQTTNQSLGFLLYQYFEDPINNAADKEQLFNYYAEILKIHPQFKMVYYADTQGNLVMLNRMNDGTFSKRLVHNDGDLIRIRWEHTNISYYGAYPNTDESFETGYDPRKRIWYRAAETEKNMTWTPVYLFATDHLPGFTCAIPIFDPAGKTIGVNSIDIAVNELSRFLGTLRPTEGTKIVILDKENNLVALQARQEKDLEKLFVKSYDSHGNTTYNVSSIDAFNDEVLRSVLQRLIVKPGTLMRIKHGNEHYESILTPISVGDGLDLNIGIIIPENDIIGHVRRNLIYVTLFSIGVLILIMIFGSLLSHAIAEPMRRLAAEMMKIKSFDLDSKVYIHTNFMEIMDMRDSFENMRNGLRNFKRYVPSELVAELIGEEIDADLGGETRELTIFFSDIADFTTIAEQTDPERLVTDLCPYFEIISKSILETKGTIDKYIGDSVMAFWGAPVRRTDHAERACRSAIVIR